MKKRIIDLLKKKTSKRIISAVLAIAMVFSAIPVSEIGEYTNGRGLFGMSAYADAGMDAPEENYPFEHSPKDSNKVSFTSSELNEYAQKYMLHPEYHRKDEITIQTTGDGSEDSFTRGFIGIGTFAAPFEGSLKIEANNPITLNLDAPLFNYVKDSVVLNEGNELKISRFYGFNIFEGETVNDRTPLLAKNVVHDTENAPATWNISVMKPSATDEDDSTLNAGLKQFGGMIGTMKSNSTLILNVKIDKCTNDEDPVDVASDTNVGLACGTMESGSTLTFAVSGTDPRKINNINTTKGNAGGLVGEMQSNSVLNVISDNAQIEGGEIRTSSLGYAGGLVGKIDKATVNLQTGTSFTAYNIDQHISGKTGCGGVYGYYRPKDAEVTIDVSQYIFGSNIQENGCGDVGGLFGMMETDHSFTLNSNVTVVSNHAEDKADSFGGLIGKYKNSGLGNTLTIMNIKADTNRSSALTYYGGAIGTANDTNANYVKFDNFTLSNARNAKKTDNADPDPFFGFGGLIATAKNTFVDANNVTINVNGTFSGGGLVGDLGNGALRLTGTTDLSNAKLEVQNSNAHKFGQIVGARDSAPVFAETGWILKRSAAVSADDIGGWGQVMRFDTKSAPEDAEDGDLTYEQYDGSTVLTVDEEAHTISIESPTSSIGTVADLAATALNIQLSSTDITTVGGIGSINSLTLSNSIDLSGTGITGFTRDNDTDGKMTEPHCIYTGSFDAAGNTVTLAIGEAYGSRGEVSDLSTAVTRSEGDGRIYNHRYNGLFGILSDPVIGDDNASNHSVITGAVSVSPNVNDVYVGAVAGVAKGTVNTYSTDVTAGFDYGGTKIMYLGRLYGEIAPVVSDSVQRSIDIYNCDLSGTVSGSNNNASTCISGAVGMINHKTNEETEWYFERINLGGTVENKADKGKSAQAVAGLIAMITGYSASKNFMSRKLTLDDITTENLEIKSAKAGSMGGLLGYQWLNTDVEVGSEDKGTAVTISTDSKITASGAVKDMAGLVYCATGAWKVNNLDINNINVSASNPRSFGMIVNKGWFSPDANYRNHDSSSALYLLLPTTDCYQIDADNATLPNATVFDELLAYSAYYSDSGDNRSAVDSSGDEYLLKNGAGIVSIHTETDYGLIMDGSSESLSYKAQTANGATANPWTRYYYNLESIADSDTDPGKLMRWALNQYAHRSISNHFGSNPFTKSISSGNYDMEGYSWYPVDLDSDITVKGTFKFYNSEFEGSEEQNGGDNDSQKTSLLTGGTPATTQHYLLHGGLFRNVDSAKTLTVSATTKLQGNVGNYGKYCGALVSGTVKGSSDTSKAKVDIQNLQLDGIHISGIGEEDYAPLIINKITTYTNLTVKNVKNIKNLTSSWPDSMLMGSDGYPKAGSSLIGEVGSLTAKGLNVSFSLIKLDGRLNGLADPDAESALDQAYLTKRSLFTKATLLDKFQFESGSTGTYTYTWDDDWDGSRNVTYGEEVGYIAEGEFPNQERIYLEEPDDTTARYTSPVSDSDVSGNTVSALFAGFVPYVGTEYSPETKTHQLEVNHRSTRAEGCGTYNDPYQIQDGNELETFAKIINGTCTNGTSVILPTSAERAVYWCNDAKDGTTHHTYTYNGTNFVNDDNSTDTVSLADVRKYLAGAYYKQTKDITLTTYSGISNFTTIGTNEKPAVFRGVYDGGEFVIHNQSDSPLIVNSYGCVVKDVRISVEPSTSIILTQNSGTDTFPNFASYGGVIGAILGGDNIFDDVSVTFDSMASGRRIDLNGSYSFLIPVGGYVGVLVDGALIFKEMDDKPQSLPSQIRDISGRTPVTVSASTAKYLYLNPIIGRVLNGYAVTEGSEYVTSEENVTLHNGRKNYSIADIKKAETEKLSTGAYTAVSGATGIFSTDVSIPNAQAWFIMSLLTQSSTTVAAPGSVLTNVGSSNSYDKEYKTMHRATYADVGKDQTQENTPDYLNYAKLDGATSGVPYLVAYYTDVIPGTSDYGVLALTSSKTVCNFSLGGISTSWTLPDGYRGVGAIGFGVKSNSDSYLNERTISLHKFSGLSNNGSGSPVTFTLNMSLQHYETAYDNYLPINNSKGGFGLFNTLHHNNSSQGAVAKDSDGNVTDDFKIKDLSITGTINYYVFMHSDPDGVMNYVKANVVNVSYLHTGGIAGYAGFESGDSITVESIGVSGLTVNGFETAGGFFGNLQLANNATNHQVKISDIEATSAFTVTSKRYAGGIIGYFKQGNLLIDDVTITLPNVINEYRGSAYQDFENGAGGVIGFAQTNSNNAPVVLTNVTLGEENKAIVSRIGYKDGSTFFCNNDKTDGCDDTVVAGGIIGRSYTIGNKTEAGMTYSLLLKDCNVFNISLYGHRVGGLIGADIGGNTTSTYTSYLAFLNCRVKSDKNSVVKGLTDTVKIAKLQHRATGGIIGGIKAKQTIVDSCSVEGYTFWSYNDTAGVSGNVESDLYIRNFKIVDVVFQSDYAASLVGWLAKPLKGYNILCDNIQFQDRKGGTNYIAASHGYLVSKNNIKSIKIAGLSCQNTTAEPGYFVPPRLSGTNDYNSGGYVIFADYLGKASDANKVFSNVNTGSVNVRNYEGTEVTDNKPYVTSSPRQVIDVSNFLTGDAVGYLNYEGSALQQIIADKLDPQKSQNGAQSYQTAPAVNDTLLNDVTEHLTTSREEFNNPNIPNFPLLTVEESNRTKITNYINYYLQNLTNTNYDFAATNNEAFKVNLHRCTYNSGTRKFEVSAANDQNYSLIHPSGAFNMHKSLIDNADPNTPQFTLMDVQFYDPASSKSKIAYHLYVPIYVKKMIQYTFSAKLASGTSYYDDAYSAINAANTMFENLGNPVTLRIEYEYDRNEEEWAAAINGGENVLGTSNFYKVLKLKMNDNKWVPNTRLVLVDANKNDQFYYRDTPVTELDEATGLYYPLEFETFTTTGTDAGTKYSPAPFNSLLDITFTAIPNGPLIKASGVSDGTVTDGNGNYYKPRPDNDTSSQGYTAAVTSVRPEIYYLSFFTNKDAGNNKVFVYELNSADRFEQHGSADVDWRPNKVIRNYNKSVRLITGNLYMNNDFTVAVEPNVYEMSRNNNILTVTMTTNVALTDAAAGRVEGTTGIQENLGFNQNSQILQTFLMNFDMRDKGAVSSKIGVAESAIKSVTIVSYKIYPGNEVLESGGDDVSGSATDPDTLTNSNYIELRNNTNLNPYLRNDENANAATIQVRFAVEFNESNLQAQFPLRPSDSDVDVGSYVRGFSNISSAAENGAFSATSKYAYDDNRYYTRNLSAATLTYNAVKKTDNPAGLYGQLGINPFDADTSKTGIGHVDTTAIYTFIDITEPRDYVEFTLTLTNKKLGYNNTKLRFKDYISGLVIKAGDTELYNQGQTKNTSTYVSYMSDDGTTIIVRALRDSLVEIADKVYSIDISFDVLTGEENGFGDGKAYSNYKVTLTADMYDDLSTSNTPDQQAHAYDHIIYTNSKLQYSFLTL